MRLPDDVVVNATGTIRVTRNPAEWRDRRRAYRVLIDDREAGVVTPDREFVVPVSPGSHRVSIKIDWTGSREVPVVVQPGDSVTLVCEPAGSAWTAVMDLLLRRPYVSLRVE